MSRFLALTAVAATLMPVAAHAECLPRFSGGPAVVTLSPGASFDGRQLSERYFVTVRNDGDSVCDLLLTVGRDISGSDPNFPTYDLFGPNGSISTLQAGLAPGNLESSTPVSIPAGGESSVQYQVRTSVGWGKASGEYVEELIYTLSSPSSPAELAQQRTELKLSIPAIANVRFASIGSARGVAQMQLGTLSPDAPTISPPFTIRVLSTSSYQMMLVSQNSGALQRINGVERIPYRMTVGGLLMNMAGGGGLISRNMHTGPTGDLYPVSVIVDADATRHAGDYHDRVTVTVTPI